ncbi:hypothetical protein VTO42DRAFT_3184 [Malbranchea cinnamomea]
MPDRGKVPRTWRKFLKAETLKSAQLIKQPSRSTLKSRRKGSDQGITRCVIHIEGSAKGRRKEERGKAKGKRKEEKGINEETTLFTGISHFSRSPPKCGPPLCRHVCRALSRQA